MDLGRGRGAGESGGASSSQAAGSPGQGGSWLGGGRVRGMHFRVYPVCGTGRVLVPRSRWESWMRSSVLHVVALRHQGEFRWSWLGSSGTHGPQTREELELEIGNISFHIKTAGGHPEEYVDRKGERHRNPNLPGQTKP